MSDVNYLLLSDSKDFTTDFVSLEFEKRGCKYLRLDRDLLHKYDITWNIFEGKLQIETNQDVYHITETSLYGVYYRAPTYLRETFSRNKGPVEQLQSSQWMAFYRNLLSFGKARWMNSPSATFYAENKMVQLKVAREMGFRVPKTILSNNYNPSFSLGNSMIVKSLDTAIFDFGEEEAFVYTNDITADELNEADLSVAPVILQENLSPKIDYRVTVVGKNIFAVKILQDNAGILGDWRKVKDDVKFLPVELPDIIKTLCYKTVRELGLNFGAIDLIYNNNEFHFIEVNPTGEWAWLADSADQKIYEAICSYLIGQ